MVFGFNTDELVSGSIALRGCERHTVLKFYTKRSGAVCARFRLFAFLRIVETSQIAPGTATASRNSTGLLKCRRGKAFGENRSFDPDLTTVHCNERNGRKIWTIFSRRLGINPFQLGV